MKGGGVKLTPLPGKTPLKKPSLIRINTKKACPNRDIPVKLIKMNENIFSRLIFENFNQSLVNGQFPHWLKEAEIIPVFKKRKNSTNPIIDL